MRVVLLVAVAACSPMMPPPAPMPPPQPAAVLDIPFQVTADAVDVHVVELAAHDAGEVAQVFVAPGQHVRTGDLLVALVVGDRANRVDRASGELHDAETAVQRTGEELKRTTAFLEYMKDPAYIKQLDEPNADQLRYAEASLEVARADRVKLESLVAAHAATRADLDRAIAQEATCDRAVAALHVDHNTAKTVLDYNLGRERVLRTELELAVRTLDTAREQLAEAQRQLAATRVVATSSGVVADVLVAPGGQVARDEPVVRISSWER